MEPDPPLPAGLYPRHLEPDDLDDAMLGALVRALAIAHLAVTERRYAGRCTRWPRWSTPAQRVDAVEAIRDAISSAAARERRRRPRRGPLPGSSPPGAPTAPAARPGP